MPKGGKAVRSGGGGGICKGGAVCGEADSKAAAVLR
nr:MAG TPA: hypothetical protein [Caudoviricetes sp.]